MKLRRCLARTRALFEHLTRLDAPLYDFPYRLGF